MRRKLFLAIAVLILCIITAWVHPATARELYGYQISDSLVSALARQEVNSLQSNSWLNQGEYAPVKLHMSTEKPRPYNNRVFDFYVVLGLIAFLAILRAIHPQYFRILFRTFSNSTLSNRQLREQLKNNAGANLGMNVFFCLSLATYAFYTLRYLNKGVFGNNFAPVLILLASVFALVLIYTVRYLSLRFAGWVFSLDTAVDSYTFNIFLINKILSVVILPFTVILALGSGPWVQICLFLSFLVVILMSLLRFTRSGASMQSFLRYSRFHFFMYLCASEILPIAVLWKLVYQWMIK